MAPTSTATETPATEITSAPAAAEGSPAASIETLLETARRFLEQEVYPREAQWLARPFAELEAEELPALRREAQRRGLWLPQIPREHGGGGLSMLDFGRLGEVLGSSPLGHYLCNCQAPDAGNMEVLLEYATAAQQERFLTPLLAGETRSCFAMTEPARAGSNPVWMDTTATRDGDEWVISGRKWFTSGADGASFSVVMAVTDAEGPRHRRASLFLVPTDTPGFRLVRNVPVLGHDGSGWASHGEVEFDECRVPADHLLGGIGDGFTIAQARLGPGRIHHCMRWLGICERSLDLLCQRAVDRELAPGETLAQQQTVQTWIADSRAEIDAARLLVLDAAHAMDRDGARAARRQISQIKFFVAGVMDRVVDRAVQTWGAAGLTDATVLSWFYTQERGARIYDGPDEVHRKVVARQVLKGYTPTAEGSP
ncbi:MAG: acyl-CoA dehydrogenase family protein [Acidobacteriota bacterium]